MVQMLYAACRAVATARCFSIVLPNLQRLACLSAPFPQTTPPFNCHSPNPGGTDPSICTDSSSATSKRSTIVSSACCTCSLLAALAARTIAGTSTLLTSPIIVAHLLHLGTLSDRVSIIKTTECAIPRLRIYLTVRRTPFMTLRNAEKLHRDRTRTPSDPHVLGARIVCAGDTTRIPSDPQNACSGGLGSLSSAAVACPERHRASGCTCAHLQYSSGLMTSLPPPSIDLLSPTRLTVKVVTFSANQTYFQSCTSTFFSMGITVATLYSVGYTHWCTNWIFIPNVIASLPIFLHVNRILFMLSSYSSPSCTSHPTLRETLFNAPPQLPGIRFPTGCSMAKSSLRATSEVGHLAKLHKQAQDFPQYQFPWGNVDHGVVHIPKLLHI